MSSDKFLVAEFNACAREPGLSVGDEDQSDCEKRDCDGCNCGPVFGAQIADPADESYKKGLNLLKNVGGLRLIFGTFIAGYSLWMR